MTRLSHRKFLGSRSSVPATGDKTNICPIKLRGVIFYLCIISNLEDSYKAVQEPQYPPSKINVSRVFYCCFHAPLPFFFSPVNPSFIHPPIIHSFIYPAIYPFFIHPSSIYPSVHHPSFICPSSIHPSFICPSFYPSVIYLFSSICLSIYLLSPLCHLSVHLSAHIHTCR